MTADPRAALDRFIAALEAHFTAVGSRRDQDDPAVDDAYDVLADAFEVYEEALAQAYSETTPFDIIDEDGDDEIDDLEPEDLDDDFEEAPDLEFDNR